MTVTNHDNVSFTGTVTCYQDLGGGLAAFGGNISNYSLVDPLLGNPDNQGFSYFLIIVQENGSPGNVTGTSSPDKITVYRPPSPPDCATHAGLGANQPLTDGNLVVHQP